MLHSEEIPKEIVLSVTNNSSTLSAIADLFDPSINYSGLNTYLASNVTVNVGTSTAIITTSEGTNSFIVKDTASATQDTLNLEYPSSNGSQIFTVNLVAGTTFDIQAITDEYDFISIEIVTIASTPFIKEVSNQILNTTLSISCESNLSLNELVQELTVSPYLLKTVSIFADTLSQVNKTFNRTVIDQNGYKKLDIEFPKLSPVSKQTVILNQPLNYIPKPQNSLTFTVLPSQTVKLIFKYEGATNSFLFNEGYERTNKNVNSQKIITMNQPSKKNPMHRLVQKKIYNDKAITALKLMKERKRMNPNDITSEKIKSAFNNTDFKKLK